MLSSFQISFFFPKIAKANWPSSREDYLWYESGTNNKQLQLQCCYRTSSWLLLAHNSTLWRREPASHGTTVWRYDQIKASALDADTSSKRLVDRIVCHQRNRYTCQHSYQEINLQTKIIFFPTSNKKLRIWGMNLICTKAAFHWSESAKAFK